MTSYWKLFEELSLKQAKEKNLDINEIEKKANALVTEFTTKGYIRKLLKDTLLEENYTYFLFYKKLIENKKITEKIPSPVKDLPNANWMTERDCCFINVRATGTEHEKIGNFIEAIKIIPSVRSYNLHLAPYLDCVFGNLYAVDTVDIIADDCTNMPYEKEGFVREDQLRVFIDAAHLLGKTVGFDLEPHTSQFSRIALDKPEIFRWIKLSNDKTTLWGNVTQEEMMTEKAQIEITTEIKALIKKILDANKMKSVEDRNVDLPTIRRVHGEIIQLLIKLGFWTVPSHTWGGVGLPRFKEYNFKDNFPRFEYRNYEDEDHETHAFGVLTPFKFYDNLPINEFPKEDNLPTLNQKTLDYFYSIFPNLQKEYGFDFVRVDFVDHVFDSTHNKSDDIPISDRLIPKVIKDTLDTARKNMSSTARTAERMGLDIEDYGRIGFNLILGINIVITTDKEMLALDFETTNKLQEINSKRDEKISIQYAIDTHDSGNPLYWAKPISEVLGAKGFAMRMFIARFSSCGLGKRPIYECMGNQDLSHGLFIANNIPRSLHWKSDANFNNFYHNLNDIYQDFSKIIDNGAIKVKDTTKNYGYWFIESKNTKESLLCVSYLEEKITCSQNEKYGKTPYKAVNNVKIASDLLKNANIEEIDLNTKQKSKIELGSSNELVIKELKPYEFRLFYINKK